MVNRTTAQRVEIQELLLEYRRTRDRKLRNKIIEEHRPLARHLAQRFASRGEPLDDLLQVAQLGMLKAVERFEPDRNFAFSTFATATIEGELKRHFRDKTWSVRVPRRAKELHLRLGRAQPVLMQRLGRAPTVAELAADMGITEDEVLQAMEAGNAYRSSSLEARTNNSSESAVWVQRLGQIDTAFDGTEHRILIDSLLESLPERERTIIRMRFFDEMTQSEIAEAVGVSQMHVSRLLSRILGELRSRLTDAI